jgi:hypothetical protein
LIQIRLEHYHVIARVYETFDLKKKAKKGYSHTGCTEEVVPKRRPADDLGFLPIDPKKTAMWAHNGD